MKLDFNLQLQQEQKLVMTPELQMAVKVLQLTSCELNEFIQNEIEENPLLDYKENCEENSYDTADDNGINDFINYLDYEDLNGINSYDKDEEYASPINFVTKEKSLWDYLKEQLHFIPLTEKQKKMGEYIIDNIDEYGYLTVDTKDIKNKFNVSSVAAAEILNIIQGFEPSGVGARNVYECLIIQVKVKGLYDKNIDYIIKNMLNDVAEENISKIAEGAEITEKKAREYIELIKTLDPKPGIRLCGDTTKYVIPDVYIEKIDGQYVVRVNQELCPTLKINKKYQKLLSKKDSPEYNYVKEKLESAMWIIKSIDQRMSTIKKVVEAILVYQFDFFEYDSDLKTLCLKDIANAAEIHESTVSRAIKGKYVQTPKGIYEIKNFFVRGIQNAEGEDISTLKIMDRIKDLIDNENKSKPYSDQEISEMLEEENISISRRTVAKYRAELNIAPSSKRKRQE